MSLMKVLLLVCLLNTASPECNNTLWSFNKIGQYICGNIDFYIRGLQRGVKQGEADFINSIEGVQCCSPPPQWSNIEIQVVSAIWTQKLGHKSWFTCPAGYFFQGLHRSDDGYLNKIEAVRCTKPSSHPFFYGDCYVEDIGICFNKKGLCSCRENYFVIGLYKSTCDMVSCLDSLLCCQMAATPEDINEVSTVKTRIMDTTLWNMANLANMLGYAWSWGCNGVNVGEDFYRERDTWKANKNVWRQGHCLGYKSDQRLSLNFMDWRFDVKQIKYGQGVVEPLQQDSLSTGIIYNNEPTSVTEEFHITETVEATITHSTTSTWRNSHELGITLNFDIPLINNGISIHYKTFFEPTSDRVDETSERHANSFSKHTTKTLAPFSAASYKVFVNKIRTTIPYTATIISKFSTEFTGFLRWDENYTSTTTNYHYLYKRNGAASPTFNYRFGDTFTPFYTALKEESEKQSRPWFWKEMAKNYPRAEHFINRLTNESQYEFILTGKLEYVAGSNINVVWETANITHRDDKLLLNSINVRSAKSGPNDKRALVKYPKVPLLNHLDLT